MRASFSSKLLSEFIGTFAIVFFGAGSVCINALPGVELGLLGIALAFGLVVAVMVATTGHVSGAHFNPAVTTMAVATRRIGPGLGAGYVGAQLLGAVSAAFVMRATVGADVGARVALGGTSVAAALTPLGGSAIEAILTFFLVLVIFGTTIDSRGSQLGGPAIGALVCLEVLVGGPLTGASMNPARSFGPALVSGQWAHHWVYWLGPLAGALLAALVYERLVAPRREGGTA